jgi:hypothetical protein
MRQWMDELTVHNFIMAIEFETRLCVEFETRLCVEFETRLFVGLQVVKVFFII